MNYKRPILISLLALTSLAQAQPSADKPKGDAPTKERLAVVEFSTAYLRQKPDYESALETQELMGTIVEIVGEQSYWREVITPQPYKAWCTDQGLVEMSTDEIEAYANAPKVMFVGLYGHVYERPSAKAATICDLVGGDLMRLSHKGKALTQSDKVRIDGRWTEVMLPSGKTGFVSSKELKVHEGFRSIAQGEETAESVTPEVTEAVIAQAERLIGAPYLWGGMSAKGVDCSGLVRISYIMNGILLPRNASQQIKCGDRIPMAVNARFWEDRSDTEALKAEMSGRIQELERGDLVFFGTPATDSKPMRVTHVGIYLGNNRIIHSSHRVRINSLIPDDEDYYENAHRLIGAVRL